MEAKDCNLKDRLESVEGRCASLEHSVTELRSEMRTGIGGLTKAVNDLGHDFGTRMNNLDKRLVEEKTKWGDALRKIVLWTVGTILTLALAAAGLNALPEVVKSFK